MSCMYFFFSSRRRHTRCLSDWSSDVCSSDLSPPGIIPSMRKTFSTGLSMPLVASVRKPAGSGRAADARRWQSALQRRGSVVVQLVVLLSRAFPVADVGFIPHLPIPALDLAPAVAPNRMEYPLAHQFPPPGVVFGRVRPALAVVGLRPVAGIRLRMDRQRFRHEADLYERLGAGSDVRVEDTVDDGPVVNRAAGSVFGVGVGRAPFERGSARSEERRVGK